LSWKILACPPIISKYPASNKAWPMTTACILKWNKFIIKSYFHASRREINKMAETDIASLLQTSELQELDDMWWNVIVIDWNIMKESLDSWNYFAKKIKMYSSYMYSQKVHVYEENCCGRYVMKCNCHRLKYLVLYYKRVIELLRKEL
jgi:hypothetical protein